MSSITDFTLDDVSKIAPPSASGGEGSGYASADQFVNVVGAALEKQESGGKQLKADGTPVTSKAGAIGIWQVMPKTAPEAAALAGVAFDDVKYRNDANYNRKIGQAYLAKQFEDFQDPAKALAAYNAGPDALKNAVRTAEKQGNPNAWLQYLPRETQNYVPAILGRVNGLTATGESKAGAGSYYTPNKTAYATYKEPGPGATFGDYIKEVGAAAVEATGAGAQFFGEIGAAAANKITGTEQYEGKNLLKPASDAIRNTMTEGGKQARKESNIEGSVLDLLSGDVQLPSTGQGWAMVAANGFGSLASTFLPVVGQANRVATLSKGLKIAEAAGDAAKAAQLAKEIQSATAATRVSGAVLGGATTGGAAADEVRQTAGRQVESMSHEELLANVPVYAEAFARSGDQQQSRDAVVNSAARWAGGLSAIAGAAGGAFNAKVVEDFLVGKGVASIAGNSFKSKATRAAGTGAVTSAGEGFQETTEKVGQNVGENIGLGRAPTDNALRNTAGDFVGGALVGGPLGAGGGYMAKPGQPAPVVHPTLAPVAEKAAQGGILSKAAMAGNAGNLATGVMPTGTMDAGAGAPAAPVPAAGEAPAEQPQAVTTTALAQPAPTDVMGTRVREIETELRGSNLLDALRLDGVNVAQVFDDLNAARNTKAPAEVRQDALSAVEELLQWAKTNVKPRGPMDTVATPEAMERTAPAADQTVPSVDTVAAALRDEQLSRLISDSDRQSLMRLMGDAQNTQLPVQTRQNAVAEAQSIIGRYQAPMGQSNGQTTPALTTPASSLAQTKGGQVTPAEQQFVNPATGAIQESDFLTDVDAPKVAIPAGKDPAFIRRRAAEIKQLVAMGFETVERNGSDFFLINSKTGQRFKLSGMADSQLARKAIYDRRAEIAAQSPNSPNNDKKPSSEAQNNADNYFQPPDELNGRKIKYENDKGSVRSGTDKDGKKWSVTMGSFYGKIVGIKGADKDALDVLVGDRPDSPKIFVIDQKNADGSFDEHKVVFGATSEDMARRTYLSNYSEGWQGLGAITEMSREQFDEWLKDKKVTKPVAYVPTKKAEAKPAEPIEKAAKSEQKQEAPKEPTPAKFATLGEAKAYISAQRRGGSSISALPYPNEDGTFGIAIKGTPGYTKAEKFAADQQKKAKKAKKPVAKQGDMFTVKDGGKDVQLQKVSKEELPTDSSSVTREGERRQLTQNDVSLLQRLASALGKEIQIFSGPVGDGFVRPEEPNTIYINEFTSVNPVAVFGHELFHKIKDENPKAWEAIAKVVEANIGKEAFDRMMGYGYEQGEVLEEIVSDLGGDFLTDGAFWRDVFGQIEADNGKEAKGIIAKLVAYLNNLVEQLINDIKQPGYNASSLVKDVRAVRAAYKEGITQYLKDTAITRPALQAQILREENAIKKSEDRGQPKVGIHFSKEPRTNLIGSLFGTGLKGAERERLSRADDMRIKRRVSFYVDEGNGITPESGVGGVAHEIKLPKLYDARKNVEGLFKDNDLNGSESRVLDAGYDGYWVAGHSNKQGVGVILGDAARSIPAKVIKAPKAVKTEAAESTIKKGLVSSEIDAIDMGNIPGATMRAGILSVPVDSREQANAELARIGSVLRFSKDRIETAEEKAKREYAEVEAQYKGTDGWLKAPNGQATELNERQWVQVRTPSFKAWFGDWEKAANTNGVFGDMQGEVSVAVDANGEPLVVYHGTNKGGFTEFKTPGGEARGDLGIFTTPNLAMAQTYYSKRGGEIDLSEKTQSELEALGYDFKLGYIVKGTDAGFFESEEALLNELELDPGEEIVEAWEVKDPNGYSVDGPRDNGYYFESIDDAVGTVNLESNLDSEQSGYYAMFINIRKPEQSDFEGAMWSGERPGQYQVMNQDGELQYDKSGRAYFDMFDDANELAKTIEGGEVQPADEHYETTDSVVRGARFSGADGAYIYNVVDSGPGYSSYIDEPSTVFVALDPNQLKSANYNNGVYSTTSDDIRKSVDRSAEDARQYKLDIEREQRAVGKAARLSADEVAAIATDAAKLGLTKAQVKALADDARRIKKQFPESEDWAQISVAGIQVKLDDDKKPVPGSEKPKFQVIPYGFNVPPGKDRAPAKTDEAWLAKVATKFEDLVLDIYDRAEKGDKNAQIIIGHQTWYRNVAEVLRREYGGAGDLLADLLGATSPNTPVDTNWKFSLDVMRQFMAGKFNDQLAKFSQFLEEGGDASKYPAGDKIRQVSGKLYGMNSVNAMKALVDMWRAIEPGQAPKARNFALNLIGQSNMATIDVWAARMLRRAADLVRGANLPRIPPPAEGGVSGVWNADATKVTGAFGFGAEVMDKVAVALEKRGIKVTPPDLQAIAWFAEKELWGQKGWTTKTGEGGSFEENIEATPVERYVAGWSIQQGERVPSTEKSSVAQARVMSMLVGDDSVMAARVLPTSGLYGGTVEASFDTEWTAMKGRHDPSMVIAEIAKIAQENKQLDIFVSKVVGPKEDNANARPGVEIYFRTARDLEAAKPVLEKFTANGQDGFTMVVDPRVTPKGVTGESFIGVRLQFVPEIAMRFDVALRDSLLKEGAAAAMLEEKRQQLNDITAEVRALDGVAFAAMQNYDTLVVGKENYSDYIDRIVEGGDQSSGNQAWFGQPLRQGLEGAAARLAGNVGQNRAGGVPNASGSVQASRARDERDGAGRNQSRGLAPLPGAPTVAGATGPDPRLVQVADEYARANGIDLRRQDAYVKVDAERATRIAQAYDAMEHAPQDPKVKEAFENLIKQTTEQYKALEKAGYKFYLYDETNDPYAGNPWNAMRDLRANKVMGVFATEAGFGSGATELNVNDNPLLADTGIKWPWGSVDGKSKRVLANDLFRAVHDAFGHGLEGAGFRAEGEENAWQAHARMFKGSALGALTTETRGQNSWLNYGPYGERNRNAKVEDTVFADQKTGLMPSWTWEEGGPGDGPKGGKKPDVKKSVDRFPNTPEFKRWSRGADTVAMDDYHDFRSGEPVVVEALHGTTNADLTEFKRSRANVESDWGAGFYASNTPEDVATNYANVDGPDLTQRVERLAEQLEQNDEFEGDMDAAREEARKRLSQGAPNTLKLFMRFDNPVVIGGVNETRLDYSEEYNEETEEYEEPTGKLVEFTGAIRDIAPEYGVRDKDIETAIGKIFEQGVDGDIKVSDVVNIIKQDLVDAFDDEGNSASHEIVRRALSDIGFDGIIDTTVSDKFGPKMIRNGQTYDRVGGMKGMNEGTIHFIAFEPNQIKSATGNNGGYSESPSITKSVARNKLQDTQEEERTLQSFKDYFGDRRGEEEYRSYKSTVDSLIEKGGKVYRLVFADTPQDVRTDNLGIHWTGDDDTIANYERSLGKHFGEGANQYVIVAEVPPGSISNQDVDIINNPEEQEVNIVANADKAKFALHAYADKRLGKKLFNISDAKLSRDRTQTAGFKKWFGDSKVVDADGKPAVVYHGSSVKGIEVFESDDGRFYFTDSKSVADNYGAGSDTGTNAETYPVYLSMQDPEVYDMRGESWFDQDVGSDVYGYIMEAKEDGRDGVILKNFVDGAGEELAEESTIYVVFSPNQIKSATDNNGDFDASNPNITKSRSRAPWFEDVEKLKLINGYQVGDFIKSSKKLSWWDKTVGTMYNLAEKYPEFKRVFDAVQRFIDDVSVYANRAADLAPNILPKLETWRDIAKAPMSAEDVQALRDPIFQGTLSFTRDEQGELMPEDDVNKAGVVFTDQELRDYFQLNDRQIGLYREFRAAVDQSITTLNASDMLRYLGEDGEGVRERVMAAKTPEQAEREIQAHLDLLIEQNPARAEVLTNTKEVISDKVDQANRLMDRGYAPLSRYGEYTVYAVGPDGEQLYFSMFESQAEANKMAREMREQYPDAEVTTGTMSKESYKLFSGVTPESLALFGEAMGLEESGIDERSQAYQQYLKLAKSNRSAMKRLIQRKGIDGFSEDAGRVLAGFVYSNARQVSTNLHAGEISKNVMAVKDGDIKDAAINLMQYIQNPQEEAQALRGLMFAQFIGGSIASALVNMTQPFTMTMPYLSQFAGVAGAGKRMADAVKLVSKGITDDQDLADALKRAEDDGVVSPQEVHQLMAQSQGKGALKSGDGTKTGDALAKANNTLAKVSLGWGKLFGAAEQFNRRVTFIAAYKVAREQGMADPFTFAENAIRETQGVYNKGNKPQWARGAVGSTLFTFKQYSVAYVEFLQRMWGNGPEGKKAVGLALLVLFVMSGLGGMPGADDLDDVIDGIAQRVFNKSFDSKAAKKEFFGKMVGDDLADFIMGGITSLPGSPIDLSGRLGLGNLIPGTGVLTKKTSYTRDVMEIAGPAGSMVSNWATAAGQLAQGEVGKAIKTVAPVAAQNAYKAWDMGTMGQYRDEKGRKVIDTDAWEAIAKGIGFQPSSVKRVQEATSTQQNLIGQNKIRETEIADLWTAGRVERDQDKIDRAKEQLAQWNKDNPSSPIKIDPAQINKRVQQANMSKAQRIAATAPKEIRGNVKKELESLNQ